MEEVELIVTLKGFEGGEVPKLNSPLEFGETASSLADN